MCSILLGYQRVMEGKSPLVESNFGRLEPHQPHIPKTLLTLSVISNLDRSVCQYRICSLGSQLEHHQPTLDSLHVNPDIRI